MIRDRPELIDLRIRALMKLPSVTEVVVAVKGGEYRIAFKEISGCVLTPIKEAGEAQEQPIGNDRGNGENLQVIQLLRWTPSG